MNVKSTQLPRGMLMQFKKEKAVLVYTLCWGKIIDVSIAAYPLCFGIIHDRLIITPTCFSGSSMNSSVLDTSTKCCRTYLCADLSRSLQECVSAKPRMPRQFEGSSWLRRNLQQASRTPLSCNRLAAGSSVYNRWKRKVC